MVRKKKELISQSFCDNNQSDGMTRSIKKATKWLKKKLSENYKFEELYISEFAGSFEIEFIVSKKD